MSLTSKQNRNTYKRYRNRNTFYNKTAAAAAATTTTTLAHVFTLLCRQNVVGHTPKLLEAGAHVEGIPSGLEVLWEKVDKEKYLYYEVYSLLKFTGNGDVSSV